MDLDIEPGVDFVEQINDAVGSCRLLIALIGPRWTSIEDARGRRRLDDSADFIRVEVEAALRRPEVRVVPVLAQGARMPATEELPPPLADLARRNALELSDARWSYDVGRLASTVQQVLGDRARRRGLAARPRVPAEAETGAGTERRQYPPGGPAGEYSRERPAVTSWLRRHLGLAIAAAAIAVAIAAGAVVFAGSSPSPSQVDLGVDVGTDRSPDDIEVSDVSATADHDPPVIGDDINVDFSLKNVGPDPVTFVETFIGARGPDPGDSNEDFGHANSGKVLDSGETVEISGTIVFDVSGVWTFFPCYSLPPEAEDNFCPSEWRSFQVLVEQ
jgi:hypothetical protein